MARVRIVRSPLLCLPTELIQLISTYLPTKTIFTLLATCRFLCHSLAPLILDKLLHNTPKSWDSTFSWILLNYSTKGLLRALQPKNRSGEFNINYQDKTGATCLHAACKMNDALTLYILLDHGAKPDIFDINGETPLHFAVQYGRENVARVLLQEGADPNLRSVAGETPLSWAVKYGYAGIVRALIEYGADVNLRVGKGETPLHWAAVQGFVEVVEILLSSGAHGEMVNWEGQTALLVAAEAGHGDVVRKFLEKGVDVDGVVGDTTLVVAARRGHQDIVRMLLEGGGKAGRNGVGETTLFMMAFYGGMGVRWVFASRARRLVGRLKRASKGSVVASSSRL